MAKFSDIIGQEHIKEHLINAVRSGNVSHAYIISGEKNAGKEFIANTFAMALQCENRDENGNPCMECHACKQAVTNNQPDIITVIHEKPGTIGVEDVRNQVVSDVYVRPYSCRWKIYIINDAEKLSVQAQNALLKTLEEPPEYVVILLLTSNISTLLPTIISRSIVLNMRPVDDKTVRKYLMERIHIPDYQADICVAFARGNIGKAKHLATSEDFDNIKNEAVRVLKYADEMDINEFVSAVNQISAYKVNIDDYMDILLIWYRDVLLLKATNDVDSLVFKDEVRSIRERAGRSSYEGIEKIIETIDKTKARLKANVNFELAMELLLLAIKEN
ncbi:MAG: DNA polymerase III subunit [Lachnospiraceae bacterium]|nr:DNA polymerase III subunit [Lachnospiraceae bacterium]MBR6487137.1 DNA polymerase III subunit [Lachnospiraceae bacterium]